MSSLCWMRGRSGLGRPAARPPFVAGRPAGAGSKPYGGGVVQSLVGGPRAARALPRLPYLPSFRESQTALLPNSESMGALVVG